MREKEKKRVFLLLAVSSVYGNQTKPEKKKLWWRMDSERDERDERDERERWIGGA